MSAKQWLVTPDDLTLSDINGWHSLGNNRYAAIRMHFLIEEHKETYTKNGPIILEQVLPNDSEFKFEQKQIAVRKNSGVFTSSMHKAIQSKTITDISSKLVAELGLGMSGVHGKTQGELQSKLSNEMLESFKFEFSSTKSYELTLTEEFSRSIILKSKDCTSIGKNKFYFYLPLWVWRWNVYLYKIEVAEVVYNNFFGLKQNRTIVKNEVYDTRMPVTQLTFYEPLEIPSIAPNFYEPEVPDGNEVVLGPLDIGCPTYNIKSKSLAEIIPVAFPVSREEKRLSKQTTIVISNIKKKRKDELFRQLEQSDVVFRANVANKRIAGAILQNKCQIDKTAYLKVREIKDIMNRSVTKEMLVIVQKSELKGKGKAYTTVHRVQSSNTIRHSNIVKPYATSFGTIGKKGGGTCGGCKF